MAGYVEGVDRSQATFLPDRLDDFVDADNPVRIVDAFVDALDLGGLGFVRAVPSSTGRPGYHPAVPAWRVAEFSRLCDTYCDDLLVGPKDRSLATRTSVILGLWHMVRFRSVGMFKVHRLRPTARPVRQLSGLK